MSAYNSLVLKAHPANSEHPASITIHKGEETRWLACVFIDGRIVCGALDEYITFFSTAVTVAGNFKLFFDNIGKPTPLFV